VGSFSSLWPFGVRWSDGGTAQQAPNRPPERVCRRSCVMRAQPGCAAMITRACTVRHGSGLPLIRGPMAGPSARTGRDSYSFSRSADPITPQQSTRVANLADIAPSATKPPGRCRAQGLLSKEKTRPAPACASKLTSCPRGDAGHLQQHRQRHLRLQKPRLHPHDGPSTARPWSQVHSFRTVGKKGRADWARRPETRSRIADRARRGRPAIRGLACVNTGHSDRSG